MKGCLAAAVVLLMGGFVRAAEDSAEALVKEGIANMQEIVKVLQSVKDKPSAEEAKPRLEKLSKRQREVENQAQALLDKNPDREKELQKKFKDEVEVIGRDLKKELARLNSLPPALAVLKEVYPLKELEDARREVAQVQARTLTAAAEGYRVRFGNLPDSLNQMTKKGPDGSAPVLEASALIDPWGRPYQYDPAGLTNKGKKSDIWSTGPDPKDPKGFIGNWDEGKKPEKKADEKKSDKN